MTRGQWLGVAGGLLVCGFLLGRVWGPSTVAFPDPEEGRTAAEMEEAVGAALDEPRAFPRSSALIRLYEGMTLQNVQGAMRALDARAGRFDPVDLQLFLTAWAHLDGRSAANTVRGWSPRSKRDLGLQIVLREWAASGQVLEAADFFRTLSDPQVRGVAAGPLARGWALSGDLDGALGFAGPLWRHDEQVDVSEGLVRGALQAVGAANTLRWVSGLDSGTRGGFEDRVILAALRHGAQERPADAASLYTRLEGNGDSRWLARSLSPIANSWAGEDPSSALDWLVARAESRERARALAQVMRVWALEDYESAWAWMTARQERGDGSEASLRDPTRAARQILLAQLIRRMAQVDPAEASSRLDEIEDPSKRETLVYRIAYFWAARDLEAARAWVEGLSLTASQRAEAARALDRLGGRGEGDPAPESDSS